MRDEQIWKGDLQREVLLQQGRTGQVPCQVQGGEVRLAYLDFRVISKASFLNL